MITKAALEAWAAKQGLSERAVGDGGIHFIVDYMDSFDESASFSAISLYEDVNSAFSMRSSNYRSDLKTMEQFSSYIGAKINGFVRKEGMSYCAGKIFPTNYSLRLVLMPIRCNNIAEFETNLYKFFEVWRDICLEARKFPGIKFENEERPIRNPKMHPETFRYDSNNRGGCYITTAVCQTLGRPDDCYELKVFREYRDNWLIKQPDGKNIIREYYSIAPRIVQTIDELKEAPDIYKEIWSSYLKKCLTMIEEHRLSDCKKLYTDMVNDLRLKYF